MCQNNKNQKIENCLEQINNMTLSELAELLRITSEEIELRIMQVVE